MAGRFITAESHGKPHVTQCVLCCAQLLSHRLEPTINNIVAWRTDVKAFILNATVSPDTTQDLGKLSRNVKQCKKYHRTEMPSSSGLSQLLIKLEIPV